MASEGPSFRLLASCRFALRKPLLRKRANQISMPSSIPPASPRTPVYSSPPYNTGPTPSKPWWTRALSALFCCFAGRPSKADLAVSRVQLQDPVSAVLNARATLAFGLADDVIAAQSLTRPLARSRAGLTSLLDHLHGVDARLNSADLADLRRRLRELLFEAGHLLPDSYCMALAKVCEPIDRDIAIACREWVGIRADLGQCLTARNAKDIGFHLRHAVSRINEQAGRLVHLEGHHDGAVTDMLGRAVKAGVAAAVRKGDVAGLRRRFDDDGVRTVWGVLGQLAEQGLPAVMQWPESPAAMAGLRQSASHWLAGASAIYQELGLKAPGRRLLPAADNGTARTAKEALKSGFGIVAEAVPEWHIVALNQAEFHVGAGASLRRAEMTHIEMGLDVSMAIAKGFAAEQASGANTVTVAAAELTGGNVVVDEAFVRDLWRSDRYTAADAVLKREDLETVDLDEELMAMESQATDKPYAEGEPGAYVALDLQSPNDAGVPAQRGPMRMDLDAAQESAFAKPLVALLKAMQALCARGGAHGRIHTVSRLMSQKFSHNAQSALRMEMCHQWLGVSGYPVGATHGGQHVHYDCQAAANDAVAVAVTVVKHVATVANGKKMPPVDQRHSQELLKLRIEVDSNGGLCVRDRPTYGLLLVQADGKAR